MVLHHHHDEVLDLGHLIGSPADQVEASNLLPGHPRGSAIVVVAEERAPAATRKSQRCSGQPATKELSSAQIHGRFL